MDEIYNRNCHYYCEAQGFDWTRHTKSLLLFPIKVISSPAPCSPVFKTFRVPARGHRASSFNLLRLDTLWPRTPTRLDSVVMLELRHARSHTTKVSISCRRQPHSLLPSLLSVVRLSIPYVHRGSPNHSLALRHVFNNAAGAVASFLAGHDTGQLLVVS